MTLNVESVGDLIAKALFGGAWKEHRGLVVPRKGNFLNPQYLTETDTYAIYYLDKKELKVVPFGSTEGNATQYNATQKVRVVIQFVGKSAERWADSVLFWDLRSDVQELFLELGAQLLLGNKVIDAVPFQQEGFNGEMSYLAAIDVVSNTTETEMTEYWTDPVIMLGSLKVEK